MYYDRENEIMYVGWDDRDKLIAVRNIQTISDLDGNVFYEWSLLNLGTVGEEGFAFANGFAYICQDNNVVTTYMVKKFPFAGITL